LIPFSYIRNADFSETYFHKYPTTMRKILLLFFVLMAQSVFAQTATEPEPSNNYVDLGSWSILNVKIDINEKWNAFVETQIRSLHFYNNFHYYEYKGGISYMLSKDFALNVGGGKYNTFQEGGSFVRPLNNDEFRSWIQLTVNQKLGRIKFESRYRAEQRYNPKGYKNRFRYRANVTIPINKAKIEPNTIYFNAWNETFLTDNAPYFERNRLFIGAGYEFNHSFSLQSGWVYQYDYKLKDEIGRDFFQISLLFKVKMHQSEHSLHPATHD
jgi:Protein of unknown function (DUF2490)